MHVGVVFQGGRKTVFLERRGRIYDVNKLLIDHAEDIHEIDSSDRYLFEPSNIFNTSRAQERLRRVDDFLVNKIEQNGDALAAAKIPESSARYLPPVPECPCMFGVVQNSPQFWRDKEEDIKKSLVAGYIRAPGSLIGHNERVEIPAYCGSFRCAAELGVVVGREAKNVHVQDAMDHVFGYTCVNDMISNFWKKYAQEQNPDNSPDFYEYLINSYYGRGTKDFGPVGPFIVSKDEVDDPYNILLYTKLNGRIIDRSYNNAMIFDIKTVISRLSSMMTLKPGTIIHMGTMGCDGITIEESRKLDRSDYIEIEIEKVAMLKNYFEDRRDGRVESPLDHSCQQ